MESSPKILITRLKSIGDVLFTLPAVNCVRQNFPEARIYYLVQQSCAALLEGFAAVDQTLVLNRSVYRQKNVFRMVGVTWQLLHTLRQERFTHAIDLHGFGETGLLTRWSGAPARWGVVYKKTRKFAYTRTVPRRDELHPIDSNLEVIKQMGLAVKQVDNRFTPREVHVQEARTLLGQSGFKPNDKFIFIQPFTSNARKDWPLENFVHVADRWKAQGVRVLFGGGPADRERLEPLLRKGYPSSAGASLMVSAALAGQSQMVIGGDTGLLHIAVALQKPVLMLLHSPAIRTVPYGHPEWTLAPLPGEGLPSLRWEAVVEKSEQMLFADAQRVQAAKLGRS